MQIEKRHSSILHGVEMRNKFVTFPLTIPNTHGTMALTRGYKGEKDFF